METKVCNRCGKTKSVEEFSARAAVPSGRRGTCKVCVNEGARTSRNKIRDSDLTKAQLLNWKRNLRRCYGLTVEDWQAMFDAQGGVCMYCQKPERAVLNGATKRLAVDHDHNCCPETGRGCANCIRGLSCSRCNFLVGMVENNLDRIHDIIRILDL